MSKKTIILSILVIIFSIIFVIVFRNNTRAAETTRMPRSTRSEEISTTMKVLVLEINPIMETITNENIYPNNNHHPRVSDYLNGIDSDKKALNELIEDLEYSSGGYVKVSYTLQEVNEYIHYKNQITLQDGTKANALDEATIIKYSNGVGQTTGSQSALINALENEMANNTIDMDYYLNKYDLVNKKNEDEFNQVWLLTYEPSGLPEITIVGKKDLDVTGNYIKANCNDFIIAGVSTKNRNSNFHHLLHGLEAIMNKLFNVERTTINTAKNYQIYTESKLQELNLWQRFTLSAYNNIKDYTALGTLHFAPNSEEELDYDSPIEVKSEYDNWTEYPNLGEGNFRRISSTAWKNDDEIDKLTNKENTSPERLYMRWWASHIPHKTGHNKDGYFNNWWKYFIELDFATNVMVDATTSIDINLNAGDIFFVKYVIEYYSGTFIGENDISPDENIVISNPDVIGFEKGWLTAKKEGTSTLNITIDNKKTYYNINVAKGNGKTKVVNPIEPEEPGEDSGDSNVLIIGGNPKSTKATTAKEEEVGLVSPETDQEKSERLLMYLIFTGILVLGLFASIFVYRITLAKSGGDYSYE